MVIWKSNEVACSHKLKDAITYYFTQLPSFRSLHCQSVHQEVEGDLKKEMEALIEKHGSFAFRREDFV